MSIKRAIDSERDGIILDANNYEDEINPIEIPHEWARHRSGASTEEEQTISRSELGNLMWISRMARPGAIYDAWAAARTSPEPKTIDSMVGNEDFSENEENGYFQKESMILSTFQAYENFTNKATKCQ